MLLIITFNSFKTAKTKDCTYNVWKTDARPCNETFSVGMPAYNLCCDLQKTQF